MSWVRGRRGSFLLVFATILCILTALVNYNILKGLPSDRAHWSGFTSQGDWQNSDVEERLIRLEKHVFGKVNNSIQQQKDTAQRLEELEQQLNIDDWLFPFCQYKVSWMQNLWQTNAKCYVSRHNLKPDSLCSILIYLSEVEKFCPVLPWRQKNATSEQKVATMRLELEDSFINDLTALNLQWIRDRVTRMWPHWVKGAKEFEKEGSLRRQHHAKKIFIFLGTYAFQPNWLDRAFTGAPLGEMVQWNAFMPEFDLIFTDYNGLTYMQMNLIPNLSPYMCRIRILDSFGTDAEFNYASYSEPIPGGKSVWAMGELNLRQILTMFPHSPDNLFLGFVVSAPVPVDAQPLRKKPEEEIKKNVPDYVITHGILSKPDLEKLLKETKVFIGLGFPYEGPAPLEAIAQGCIFLNAKFDPPHSRLNTLFFKGKPTLRELSSQHPYAEVFIGEPHVKTIDIGNLSLVEDTIKSILNTEVKPYLPFEWTPKGMLERVNAFTEYLHFCEHVERWPPLSEMKLLMGETGKSCVEVCKIFGAKCGSVLREQSLMAPCYNLSKQSCTLQSQPLLFNCVRKDPNLKRLCPCRDFQSQQVAFCKQCH
ncbi:hypothetical protein P5673_015486 [Acropora cervicornis]|uniref:alpha-1,6-mannosyl-glycoprotein 6-beta-N-acetylglucosaminyltransferase n=1 Tax=Acropora cervicornis TaxID=6130 RepID=A0AAD9V512_ACRCE|nr:hypothetical protein P5673_015486 [Acropora cervicornis]